MIEEIIIDGVDVAGCEYLNKVVNEEPYCNIDEEHLYTCSSDENCYYKELKHLQRENKEKIDIIEQMIKILYPNANDDELYDVTFNGEYIDKLKELKDTADTMLMANDIKKLDIDSLREANDRLEQENKELKEDVLKWQKEFSRQYQINENKGYSKAEEKYRSALEKIKDLCTHYENTNDKCVINCYAHFIVTDLIQNKVNEVLDVKY